MSKAQIKDMFKNMPKRVTWLLLAAAFIVVLILLTMLMNKDNKKKAEEVGQINIDTASLILTQENVDLTAVNVGESKSQEITINASAPVHIFGVEWINTFIRHISSRLLPAKKHWT